MGENKTIGILGGSFNPPHLGHVAIARYVLEQGKVDQVWVIPCFEHPWDKDLLDFNHREKMCRLAFAKFKAKVRVLDIEKRLGGKSYTWRTVQALMRQFPAKEFLFLLGEDAAAEAKHWHRYEALKNSLPWLMIPRGVQSPIPNISATQIRKQLREQKILDQLLPSGVIQYIKEHQLFKVFTE